MVATTEDIMVVAIMDTHLLVCMDTATVIHHMVVTEDMVAMVTHHMAVTADMATATAVMDVVAVGKIYYKIRKSRDESRGIFYSSSCGFSSIIVSTSIASPVMRITSLSTFLNS